ncbi:MAG: WD40/YVTN/BNR-like repeat-containing protein, partial [Chitinophagaceae bacterium]
MEFSILPHPLKNSLLLLSLASLLTVFSCRNNAESEYEENEYELTEQGIQEELEMMRDPRTGRVPTEKLLLAKYAIEQSKEFARANRLQLLNWIERGPNADVAGPFSNSRPNSDITAGRLRGLMIDSTDPTKRTVWVGSVSGGLWKTTNITAAPPTWTLVNDFLANMNIADICQDPRVGSQNIMYLCTGEAWYNSAAGQGIGVFKSTDGGNTWSYLSSTSAYTYCTRILCDYQGNVYLGTRDGLFRSTNGGTSWTNITPSTAASPAIGDLEISTTGGPARLHMVTGNIYSDQSYRYTDIPATATTNSGWNSPVTPFPSYNNLAQIGVCGNTLYAAPTNNSNQVTTIYKSVDGGANWAATATSPASSIFGSQGWIHLTVGINPANPNECIVGGLDNARTLDGGNTWSKISVWVGTTGQYAHADQCDIQWWDGGNKLLLGTDGG